jgi:hypothetical protein
MRGTKTAGIAKVVGIGAVALALTLGSLGPAAAGMNPDQFNDADFGAVSVASQTLRLEMDDPEAAPTHQYRGRFIVGFAAE